MNPVSLENENDNSSFLIVKHWKATRKGMEQSVLHGDDTSPLADVPVEKRKKEMDSQEHWS